MPTSFPTGLTKVEADRQPRVVTMAGNEPELRKMLCDSFTSHTDFNNTIIECASDNAFILSPFIQGFKTTKESRFVLSKYARGMDTEWLPKWLSRTKNAKLLIDCGQDNFLANKISEKLNTRAVFIDCMSPSTANVQNAFYKLMAEKYSQSSIQTKFLLEKNNWQVSGCIQLLQKLSLLNLSLSSDIISQVGVVHNSEDEFFTAMTKGNTAIAMTTLSYLNYEQSVRAVNRLSLWLNDLGRVKAARAAMKPAKEIAFELRMPVKHVEGLWKVVSQYDFNRINTMALAIASAQVNLNKNISTGVMEVLVSQWQR